MSESSCPAEERDHPVMLGNEAPQRDLSFIEYTQYSFTFMFSLRCFVPQHDRETRSPLCFR